MKSIMIIITRDVFVNQTLTARTVGLVGGVLAGLALALTGPRFSSLFLFFPLYSSFICISTVLSFSYFIFFIFISSSRFILIFLYFLSKTGPSALLQTSTFIRRRMGWFLFLFLNALHIFDWHHIWPQMVGEVERVLKRIQIFVLSVTGRYRE